MIFGNKVDLVEHRSEMRKIGLADAKKFAQARNATFYETSVFNPEVLHTAINDFLEEIVVDKCEESLEKRISKPAPADSYCNMCVIF